MVYLRGQLRRYRPATVTVEMECDYHSIEDRSLNVKRARSLLSQRLRRRRSSFRKLLNSFRNAGMQLSTLLEMYVVRRQRKGPRCDVVEYKKGILVTFASR